MSPPRVTLRLDGSGGLQELNITVLPDAALGLIKQRAQREHQDLFGRRRDLSPTDLGGHRLRQELRPHPGAALGRPLRVHPRARSDFRFPALPLVQEERGCRCSATPLRTDRLPAESGWGCKPADAPSPGGPRVELPEKSYMMPGVLLELRLLTRQKGAGQ